MQQAQNGYFPDGFSHWNNFDCFLCFLLGTDGVPEGTKVVFVGSSVTGQAWDGAGRFDRNGPGTSDFDIALVSSALWQRAKALGIHGSPSVAATGELQQDELRRLDLGDLTERLTNELARTEIRRPVNFKIYNEMPTGVRRLVVDEMYEGGYMTYDY